MPSVKMNANHRITGRLFILFYCMSVIFTLEFIFCNGVDNRPKMIFKQVGGFSGTIKYFRLKMAVNELF